MWGGVHRNEGKRNRLASAPVQERASETQRSEHRRGAGGGRAPWAILGGPERESSGANARKIEFIGTGLRE